MKTFKIKTIQVNNWYDTIFSLLLDPRQFVHSLFFWYSIGKLCSQLWSMILKWIIILLSLLLWIALNIEYFRKKHFGWVHKPQIANKMKMMENCWFWCVHKPIEYFETNWTLLKTCSLRRNSRTLNIFEFRQTTNDLQSQTTNNIAKFKLNLKVFHLTKALTKMELLLRIRRIAISPSFSVLKSFSLNGTWNKRTSWYLFNKLQCHFQSFTISHVVCRSYYLL